MSANIFEQASRIKLRFETPKTHYTTEDLWALPLISKTGTSLNSIAIDLHQKINGTQDISFVKQTKVSPERSLDELRLEIVKHIIQVRETEAETKAQAAEKQSQIQKLESLIEQKEAEQLNNLPIDKLKEQLAALKGESTDKSE